MPLGVEAQRLLTGVPVDRSMHDLERQRPRRRALVRHGDDRASVKRHEPVAIEPQNTTIPENTKGLLVTHLTIATT